MAFTVPSMPLLMRGWHNWTSGVSTYAAPDYHDIACNLTPGKRVMLTQDVGVLGAVYSFPMEFLVPKLTDLRPRYGTKNNDVVEVPQGSGRFYELNYVDDVAKGFANEYRFAIGNRYWGDVTFSDITFSVPVPLP